MIEPIIPGSDSILTDYNDDDDMEHGTTSSLATSLNITNVHHRLVSEDEKCFALIQRT